MPSQPNREREIFEAALELTSPEARSGYLLGVCGNDAELHARVESLLRAHDQAGGFLRESDAKPSGDSPAKTLAITTHMLPVTEKAGDRIGRYKLREKIGEGGCGVVYVAEQQEPVRRRVALKVIKLGMDTQQVIARFEAERQALAMMDHPNIAKVLDAGATETGRPYFVMELVRGIKITEYCDQNKLPTRERLNLFIKVCQAVQHAHQKGIIHRDLKPSNILVTLHDGVPVPKVIDFGISKATEGRLTELTVYTELNQFIGTPAYMSPEQAEMSGLDIDTRSDIYSLGVLLYEMLTGQTPFDAKELLQSGLDQMRRTIREREPQRPSTRLSTMINAELTTVARRHAAEPPKLVNLIRGDLDWIVMKALEKDRTRRYETANGLAADLNRHLHNEPIVARPPSSAYRFQKLVRRNKLSFAAAGAIVVALLFGVITSSWQAVRATKAERDEKAARLVAEQSQARESEQRAVAEANARKATASEQSAHRLLYDADISLAQHAWEQGNLSRMVSLLDAHRPKPGEVDDRGFEYFYLQELAKGEQDQVLGGHTNAVYAIAISPDGKWLASRSVTETRLWDLSARTMVAVWPSVRPLGLDSDLTEDAVRSVWNVSFSYDSQYLAIAAKEGVQLYQISTGRNRTLSIASNQKAILSPVTNLIAFNSSDSMKIHLWDYLADKEVGLSGPAGEIWLWSPDGSRLLTDQGQPTIRWWNVTSLKNVTTISAAQYVFGTAQSHDGQLLAVADWQGGIKLIQAADGKDLGTLPNDDIRASALAFSPDGKLLATGSRDQAIVLWDVTTRQPVRKLRGHHGKVNRVAFTPDGQWLVSGGMEGSVMVWNLTRPVTEPAINNQLANFGFPPPQFSPDGNFLALAGTASRFQDQIFNVSNLQKPGIFSVGQITAFSPNSDQVAVLLKNGNQAFSLGIAQIGASSNRATIPLGLPDTRIVGSKLSPDGTVIALDLTSRGVGSSILCDAATGENILSVTNSTFLAYSCFLPDGRTWAFAAGSDITLWDLLSLKVARTLHCGSSVSFFTVSADGRFLADSHLDNLISLWDLNSGIKLGVLSGHQDHIWSLAFSADGRTLASGSEDRTIKLWDVATRRELASFPQDKAVYWLSFSPDDQMLVFGGIGSYQFLRAPREDAAIPSVAHKLFVADLPTNSVWRIPDGARPPSPRMVTEKEECFTNMFKIYTAIMAYRKDHNQMPDWLSDLVPEYLSDTNCLICPTHARTGQTSDIAEANDLKLTTSYIYEFSAHTNTSTDMYGFAEPGDTMKALRTKQLAHYGGIVPVVRCFLHNEVLSITYAGKRLEGNGSWEYAAEGKLRTTNPNEAEKWLLKMEKEGDAPTLNDFAWRMAVSDDADQRDGLSAVRLAEKAVAMPNGKVSYKFDTLAAAYAETGQFDKAVSSENEAILLETDQASKSVLQSHLKLFESHTPYREYVP
jgi:serine/threonine protein kinase/WD40 repeat protein